jgi:hypothetical protein
VKLNEQRQFAARYGLKVKCLERLGPWVNGNDFRVDYYHPITCKKTGMYRVRKSAIEGQGKYRQPADTLPEAYYCPLLDWKPVLTALGSDKKPPLLITEGELKSCQSLCGRIRLYRTGWCLELPEREERNGVDTDAGALRVDGRSDIHRLRQRCGN